MSHAFMALLIWASIAFMAAGIHDLRAASIAGPWRGDVIARGAYLLLLLGAACAFGAGWLA